MSRIAAPYVNAGNPLVLSMVPSGIRRVLDVGCGGGDNARYLRLANPGIEVVGLTHSHEEAVIATPYLDAVHVVDLENDLSDGVVRTWGEPFDLLLFSHVLEHLTDPVRVLQRCITRLSPGGYVLIAVPNVLEWRTRMEFLFGNFLYSDHGMLDRTHVRFFTFVTAFDALIVPVEGLSLIARLGRGSVPLGPLRRMRGARSVCGLIDHFGVTRWPNLFARETVMLAQWLQARG